MPAHPLVDDIAEVAVASLELFPRSVSSIGRCTGPAMTTGAVADAERWRSKRARGTPPSLPEREEIAQEGDELAAHLEFGDVGAQVEPDHAGEGLHVVVESVARARLETVPTPARAVSRWAADRRRGALRGREVPDPAAQPGHATRRQVSGVLRLVLQGSSRRTGSPSPRARKECSAAVRRW